MLEVIVALIGIVVTTMVMIAGLLTFRNWGDEQGVNPVYPDQGDREAPLD